MILVVTVVAIFSSVANSKIEKENFMLNVIYGLIVIGGALLYDDKKYKQYGGGYTFRKFLEY